MRLESVVGVEEADLRAGLTPLMDFNSDEDQVENWLCPTLLVCPAELND